MLSDMRVVSECDLYGMNLASLVSADTTSPIALRLLLID
jgi:hypothetical protein